MNDQPTPQHDDETALVHAVMNTLDGALHHDIDCRDVKAILDALKSAGYELVNQVGTYWPPTIMEPEEFDTLKAELDAEDAAQIEREDRR